MGTWGWHLPGGLPSGEIHLRPQEDSNWPAVLSSWLKESGLVEPWSLKVCVMCVMTATPKMARHTWGGRQSTNPANLRRGQEVGEGRE